MESTDYDETLGALVDGMRNTYMTGTSAVQESRHRDFTHTSTGLPGQANALAARSPAIREIAIDGLGAIADGVAEARQKFL